MEQVLDLFADGFVAELDYAGTITTRTQLLKVLNAIAASRSMGCHQMLMPLIEVDGDKATGTWYMFGCGTSKRPEGEQANWVQSKYENEYVRVDGRWKLSHLKFILNFQTPYDEGWVKTRTMQR